VHIKCIEIGNFRKLQAVRIDLADETTTFVGANNSGKTSAMVALRRFLVERSDFSVNDFTLSHWRTLDGLGTAWEMQTENTTPDTYDSSVELDQVHKDQLTPAIPARLHKQSAFRKPAKLDRRETEIFRKRPNLRCCAVIVARQEHDSSATMYGRILVKDGSDQMVEALDQSSASEGLGDGLGRRLSSKFLRGHAVGIGHIDDRLALPGGQRLRDIPVRLETDSQKDDVRLDRFGQVFGKDRGSDRGRVLRDPNNRTKRQAGRSRVRVAQGRRQRRPRWRS
jgi:AAA ATPase domain